MSDFDTELKDFQRGVECLLEELKANATFDEAETQEYLHRIIANVTDFAYLAEGANEQQLAFLNNDWPSRCLAALQRYFQQMVSDIDGEFRQIFKMEFSELMSRIRFYVKIPKSDSVQQDKNNSATNQARTSNQTESVHPNYAFVKLMGDNRKKALLEHFSPWALTPYCQQMLTMLIDSLVDCLVQGDQLVLVFKGQGAQSRQIRFGPPYLSPFKEVSWPPVSYQTLVMKHNEIVFGDGLPHAIHFSGYQQGPQCGFHAPAHKASGSRYIGFCDVGSNWFVWDNEQRNNAQEPTMLLVRSEVPITAADVIPSQHLLPFGVGGLLIRSMGYYLFPDALMFSGFSWDT